MKEGEPVYGEPFIKRFLKVFRMLEAVKRANKEFAKRYFLIADREEK